MCQIAGYVGPRRAAPIIIEMLRRQEFIDGGICTGIATISDGKLYMRKVFGDLETLLNETDALDLPGNIGFIHSRPSGKFAEFSHPFISPDNNTAVILNGTGEQTNTPEYIARKTEIMTEFFNRGDKILSETENSNNKFLLPNGNHFHPAESYAHYINDLVKKGMSVSEATYTAFDDIPGDIVISCLNTTEPDAITISRITRPCTIALGNGESFFSTSALGLPDDADDLTVFSAPVAAVCKLKAGSFKVEPLRYKNFKVEPIPPRAYAFTYNYMEKLLSEATEETALDIDELSTRKYWSEIWTQPAIDCKYSTGKGYLKPYTEIFYAVLYDFYKQGRLHDTFKIKPNGNKVRKFWID